MSWPRSARTTLGIWLACLGLGGVLFVTRHDPSSAERLARENNLFTPFPASELVRLAIERPGRADADLVLRRSAEPDGFLLGAKGELHAETAQVDELLRALEFATFERRIAAENVDLDAFGFRAPRLTVTLEFEHGSARLLIGNPAPAPADSFYAEVRQLDASPFTGTVSGTLLRQLELDPDSLRGRLLLPYAKRELAELSIESGSARVVLTADALGFRLAAGGRRVDRELSDRLLFQLARLVPDQLVPLDAARLALDADPAQLLVEERPQKGASVRVRLGASCPGRADALLAERLGTDALAGCFSSGVLPDLRRGQDELTDRSLAPLTVDELDHALVRGPRGTVELVRKDAGFELRGSREQALSLELGTDFLRALVDTAGELTNEPLPARAPDGSVQLVGAGPLAADGAPEQRLELRVWLEGAAFFVERSDDGARLRYPRAVAWFLEGDAAFARDKKLMTVPAAELSGLEIRYPDGTRASLRRLGADWQFELPAGFAVDAHRLGELLRELEMLEVERFVSEPPHFEESARLSLERGQKAAPVVLEVGQRVRGGHLARLSGEASCFILAPQTVRTLLGLPLDQSAFLLHPSELVELSLRTPNGSWHFERRGDSLVELGSSDSELGAALTEILGQLHALDAAHVGPAHAEEGLARPILELSGKERRADGGVHEFSLVFGAAASYPGAAAIWARERSLDASFFVERSAIDQLLDAL